MPRNRMSRLFTMLCTVIATIAMTATVSLAARTVEEHPSVGGGGNPNVLPPGSSAFGKTYGEWSAENWKWLFSIPAASNPANDFTGVNATLGQSGNVWYLAGSFCPEPPATCSNFTVTRTFTMPAGVALFVPILDAECSTAEGNGTTDAELRACAQGFMDLGSGLSCDIDGVSVENLNAYRVQSPLFTFGPLPAGNILGAPVGSTSPSVSDGVFLMIRPLKAGAHTIHYTGAIPSFGFGMDITYHITVGGTAVQSGEDQLAGPNAGTPQKKTTWGSIKAIYR